MGFRPAKHKNALALKTSARLHGWYLRSPPAPSPVSRLAGTNARRPLPACGYGPGPQPRARLFFDRYICTGKVRMTVLNVSTKTNTPENALAQQGAEPKLTSAEVRIQLSLERRARECARAGKLKARVGNLGAAIDYHRATGNILRFVAGQEQNYRGDFLRRSEPAQGNPR